MFQRRILRPVRYCKTKVDTKVALLGFHPPLSCRPLSRKASAALLDLQIQERRRQQDGSGTIQELQRPLAEPRGGVRR